VQEAHDVIHRIENAVTDSFPRTETTVHVEPIEEDASWEDSDLVRIEGAKRPKRHQPPKLVSAR
jgi:hypothetical protein